MNRVNTPSKYLVNVVNNNQKYYIGFGIKSLTDVGKSNKDINDLIKGNRPSIIITGRSGALRENTAGKYVRANPLSKTSVWRHIEFFSIRFDRLISYDREFNVWKKELLYKHDLELFKAKTPQAETILHFPKFTMKNDPKHFYKAGAAMNMAIQLGSYFMLYDEQFEPIIPVTKTTDKSILPAGVYGSITEKLDTIEKNMRNAEGQEDAEGNSYRFAVLKKYNPIEVTMGIAGFNDYLMFEYTEHNLMILENLKSGNATYLFRLSNFDKEKALNKDTARKEKSFIARVIHENMDDWKLKMEKYFINHN